MAAARKSASSAPRSKTVPVRVIKSSQPRPAPLPPAPTPKVPFVKKMSNVDRRERLMWTGVVFVAALILFLWIGFARNIYTSPNGEPETLFSRITNEFSAWVKKLREPKNGSVNLSEKELDELRNSVFPKLKNDPVTLETIDADQNSNANIPVNLNSTATNGSFNVNGASQ